MTGTSQSIDINASAQKVWSVMCELERWPDWAPTFHRVSRISPAAGRGAVYRIEQPRLPVARMTVDEWRRGEGFTWSSTKPLLRAQGLHWIEPITDDACRVRLEFRFERLLAPLVWLFIGKLVREYVESETRALKARAEAA